MRRCRSKPIPLIAGLMIGLLVAILAVPLMAQPKPVHEAHPYYDITKEVTISGTVSVVAKHEGMMTGSHLILETGSGRVDANLGAWGLTGKGALSVAPGEQVEVTGIMKTIKNNQVFVVRTVKTGSQLYTIRNVHGVPLSPQSRERMSQKNGQKGAWL